jgi:lipopolysaccharide export system protein LptA
MWTPKRIMMLGTAFVLSFFVYLGYGYTSFGRMDGLPPLPDGYLPDPEQNSGGRPPILRESKLLRKLKQAFGEDCPEQKRAIKLLIDTRNMVIAAEQFTLAENGKVHLTPLSLAVFSREKEGQQPEITCLRATEAWLTFDRPVSSFAEMSSRKLMEAELNGKIVVTNDRRRPQRDEDLRMTIDAGRLFYNDILHKIRTESVVRVEDFKSKPDATKITGQGMEVQLATEAPKGKPQRKGARETISGVKWICLHSAVDMHIYIDAKSGFGITSDGNKAPPKTKTLTPTLLSATRADTNPVPQVAPGVPNRSSDERSHLHITSPGSFRYDFQEKCDLATFEITPGAFEGEQPKVDNSISPKQVLAIRYNQQSKNDILASHRLQLRIKKRDKNAPAASQPEKPLDGTAKPASADRVEIESVHAVANANNPASDVTLTSDVENVSAVGKDFFHDAATSTTVLIGSATQPVRVIKDKSNIEAKEIRIRTIRVGEIDPQTGKPEEKAWQQITASGPGNILLIDEKTKGTQRAYWSTLLTSGRDGKEDLLTLTGNARFEDQAADQNLRADTLKVWLESGVKNATPRGEKGEAKRPKHLEATGNVVGRSKEMLIHETGRFVVWFEEAPRTDALPPPMLPQDPREDRRPAGLVPSKPTTPPSNLLPGGVVPNERRLPKGPLEVTPSSRTPSAANTAPNAGAPNPSNQKPFTLSARSVEAWLIRGEEKTTVSRMRCDGSVHLTQEPAKPDEKGVEVRGETLLMTASGLNLYHFVVTGDFAELHSDKVSILGPEITIDQTTNVAFVTGSGSMKMESVTTFQGERLTEPVPLTVLWQKNMYFDGASAEFYEEVHAEQDNAKMMGHCLLVTFDKTISLRQGNKSTDPAKVKMMTCSATPPTETEPGHDLLVAETKKVGEQVVEYQRLAARGLILSSLEEEGPAGSSDGKMKNLVTASGPGTLRKWERSSSNLGLGEGNKPTPPPNNGGQMKMTWVSFGKSMHANNKTKTAKFYGNVRLLHIPCDRHDKEINPDAILASDLPTGAMFLRCDHMVVLDSPENGKPNKQLSAVGQVTAMGRDFHARADKMTYNDQKQQVILEAAEGGYAVLTQYSRPGVISQRTEARQVIYDRTTGIAKGIGARSVSGEAGGR